ncbi:hypothetical protein [Oceanobacillus oncorhynchi]|uniref:hypothetical protein n=1 Tax=Oceanobacillus oncorhynchi TaxID=545501 RepID=UPI002F96D47C
MSKYFIQVRTNPAMKNISGTTVQFFDSHSWVSRGVEYDNYNEAEQRCRELIDETSVRADNIRICEVVGEFKSTVSVKTKEQG